MGGEFLIALVKSCNHDVSFTYLSNKVHGIIDHKCRVSLASLKRKYNKNTCPVIYTSIVFPWFPLFQGKSGDSSINTIFDKYSTYAFHSKIEKKDKHIYLLFLRCTYSTSARKFGSCCYNSH